MAILYRDYFILMAFLPLGLGTYLLYRVNNKSRHASQSLTTILNDAKTEMAYAVLIAMMISSLFLNIYTIQFFIPQPYLSAWMSFISNLSVWVAAIFGGGIGCYLIVRYLKGQNNLQILLSFFFLHMSIFVFYLVMVSISQPLAGFANELQVLRDAIVNLYFYSCIGMFIGGFIASPIAENTLHEISWNRRQLVVKLNVIFQVLLLCQLYWLHLYKAILSYLGYFFIVLYIFVDGFVIYDFIQTMLRDEGMTTGETNPSNDELMYPTPNNYVDVVDNTI